MIIARLTILLCIVLLTAGCLQSDKPLLVGDVSLKPTRFSKVCELQDRSSCLTYWNVQMADGRIVGGQIFYPMDWQSAVVDRLSGTRDFVIQFTESGEGKKHYQYAMLRVVGNDVIFYDIEVSMLNIDFLKQLHAQKKIKLTVKSLPLGGAVFESREVVVLSRAALFEIFKALSALPEPTLNAMGKHRYITSLTTAETDAALAQYNARFDQQRTDRAIARAQESQSAKTSGRTSAGITSDRDYFAESQERLRRINCAASYGGRSSSAQWGQGLNC